MFKRVRNWLTKKWKKPTKTSDIAVVKPKDPTPKVADVQEVADVQMKLSFDYTLPPAQTIPLPMDSLFTPGPFTPGPTEDLYSLMNRLRPTCDICNRPVEGMTIISQNAKGETVFVVDCHGDTQRLAIDPGGIKGANNIQGGRAFVGKKKGEAHDALRPEDLIPEHRRQLGLPELPNQINRVDE